MRNVCLLLCGCIFLAIPSLNAQSCAYPTYCGSEQDGCFDDASTDQDACDATALTAENTCNSSAQAAETACGSGAQCTANYNSATGVCAHQPTPIVRPRATQPTTAT